MRSEAKNSKSTTYSGKGKMFLTNNRLILVNTEKKAAFSAFAIITAKVYNEKIEKPSFKSNFFRGCVKTYTSAFPQDLDFKLWFHSGNLLDFFDKWFIAKEASEKINDELNYNNFATQPLQVQ